MLTICVFNGSPLTIDNCVPVPVARVQRGRLHRASYTVLPKDADLEGMFLGTFYLFDKMKTKIAAHGVLIYEIGKV